MEDDHEDEHKTIKHDHVNPPSELVPAPGGEEEPSPDAGSKGRSMKIKIKMPPSPPPPRPLPEPNNSTESSFGRVCCGKFFPSGKAWGGHKRHHALKESQPHTNNLDVANKFEDVEKNTKKVGVIKSGDVKVSNGGKPECCLCGKNFPSMNALFGHMRFHRDRGWKGIKPPTKYSSASSSPNPSRPLDVWIKNPSDSSDDSNGGTDGGIAGADLMGSLPIGWTTKGWRGRVGSCSFDYSPLPVLVPPSFTEMFIYPVRFLDKDKDKDPDDHDKVVVPNKRMRKEEEEEEEGAASFPCGICNKVFTSRQALGDHQRSHNCVFGFNPGESHSLAGSSRL